MNSFWKNTVKFTVTIIVSINFFTSFSQSNIDTSTLQYLLQKADGYSKINNDSALIYSHKALKYIAQSNDSSLISQVYKTLGKVMSKKFYFDSAAYYYTLALDYIPKQNNEEALADLYDLYGGTLLYLDEFDTALYYLHRSLSINKHLQTKEKLMRNYLKLGGAYRFKGAYEISSQYNFKGLPIAEELNDSMAIIMLLHNIGVNYELLKEPELSIYYCKRALEYSLAIENFEEASMLINTIANSYITLQDYDEALHQYQLSHYYAKRAKYPIMEAAALVNIGECYTKRNQFDSALFYLTKGDSIAQKINNVYVINGANLYLGELYLQTGKYRMALKHLQQVVDNKDQAEVSIVNEAYLKLSKLYEKKGNYKKAYDYHLIYSQRNDSAINKQKAEEIANLKMDYELNKKQEQMDYEVQQQEARLKVKMEKYRLIRNVSIIGLFAVIIIATLVIISFRSMQRQKVYNMKNEIDSYRQRLMAQQMNPHFIFNTLNSIQYFIYNNKKEESMEFVSQFAQLMRLNLYNSQNDIIALKDEIEALKLYLELERIRLENKFDYSIEIDPALNVEKQMVPSFLIQPLVENSIKHGILEKEQKGNIQTKIILKEGSLVYSIIDNGIGFEKSKALTNRTQHTSYGLELTKKRIALIGILNNKQTSFTFTDINEKNGECIGSKVELVIPSSLQYS